jgi:AcrR family transcriptional regulator
VVAIPTNTFLNLSADKRERIVNAAVKEFAARRFTEAKLSNIIKEAKIPRGSFYQYFADKMDLYKHIFDIIAEKKIEYMTESLKNPHDLAFFDLFRELYSVGLTFALDNPDYVRISSLMFSQKDFVYKEIFGDNIDYAISFYKGMIERDQEQGRMDPNIDPSVLAKLVIDMTMNVTLEALGTSNRLDPEIYKQNIEKIIYIFEKGIKR